MKILLAVTCMMLSLNSYGLEGEAQLKSLLGPCVYLLNGVEAGRDAVGRIELQKATANTVATSLAPSVSLGSLRVYAAGGQWDQDGVRTLIIEDKRRLRAILSSEVAKHTQSPEAPFIAWHLRDEHTLSVLDSDFRLFTVCLDDLSIRVTRDLKKLLGLSVSKLRWERPRFPNSLQQIQSQRGWFALEGRLLFGEGSKVADQVLFINLDDQGIFWSPRYPELRLAQYELLAENRHTTAHLLLNAPAGSGLETILVRMNLDRKGNYSVASLGQERQALFTSAAGHYKGAYDKRIGTATLFILLIPRSDERAYRVTRINLAQNWAETLEVPVFIKQASEDPWSVAHNQMALAIVGESAETCLIAKVHPVDETPHFWPFSQSPPAAAYGLSPGLGRATHAIEIVNVRPGNALSFVNLLGIDYPVAKIGIQDTPYYRTVRLSAHRDTLSVNGKYEGLPDQIDLQVQPYGSREYRHGVPPKRQIPSFFHSDEGLGRRRTVETATPERVLVTP